jgi:hypothetical protein
LIGSKTVPPSGENFKEFALAGAGIMIGAVILASAVGLTGFVVSMGTGSSFLGALAVYSVTGTVTLAASLLWSFAAPWLNGEDHKARAEWSLAPHSDS